MLDRKRKLILAVPLCLILLALVAPGQTIPPPPSGKMPVIVIPGLAGSNLVNRNTEKLVWFKASRAKDDDVRLPISPNLSENIDNLEARDILRSVRLFKILPEVEVYERLINELEERGYREAKWTEPGPNDGTDTFFVFPYDWRRDNVETARLLIKKIESLKEAIGKPDLKFIVIAHSMGGLIARYAAMYGDADIPRGKPSPAWAGARHFSKIFLLGTPNEGSILAINALLNGTSFSGGGFNIPFVRNISRFDVFTIPSVYQLLPRAGTLMVYNEELEPLKLDIFNEVTWDEYDWSIWKHKDFHKKFNAIEQSSARLFFRSAMERARRFQEALEAAPKRRASVDFYLVGSDCRDTQNAIILRRNEKKDKWITQFKASRYKTSSGRVIEPQEIKNLLFTKGDGVVTLRSFARETAKTENDKGPLPIKDIVFECEEHTKLVSNKKIPERIFAIIDGEHVN